MRLKTKKSNRRMGRPANIPIDIQRKNMPDNYPTLIRYLEATGKIRHTSHVQMMRARYLYLRSASVESIASDTQVDPAIIERWALCFGWEEERDRRLFETFRRISGLRNRLGQDTSERHDRIAGTIEQCSERLLHQHQNGKLILSARDLATIAGTIKQTQEIRRVARGLATSKSERDVTVNVTVPQNLDRLASAIADVHERPKLIQAETKRISVKVGEAIGTDTEFEDRETETDG